MKETQAKHFFPTDQICEKKYADQTLSNEKNESRLNNNLKCLMFVNEQRQQEF
jgi:hypothetical protein